jgi:hypothetical protein
VLGEQRRDELRRRGRQDRRGIGGHPDGGVVGSNRRGRVDAAVNSSRTRYGYWNATPDQSTAAGLPFNP